MTKYINVWFEDNTDDKTKQRILKKIQTIAGVGIATLIIDEHGNWPAGITDTMNSEIGGTRHGNNRKYDIQKP